MAQQIQIFFDIALDGNVTAEVKGVKGAACKDELKGLEELGVVTTDVATAEMWEQAQERDGIVKNSIGGIRY